MSLIELSLMRAEVPEFPGQTFPEKLANARRAAFDTLRVYKPDLQFDPDGAKANFRVVDAWIERNQAAFEAVMADPKSESMPEQIRLAFDAKTAQDFVVAVYTMAAAGLGPWMSGAVAQNTSQDWATQDATARLHVFGSIIQMHNSGYLRSLFSAPQGAAGLGFAPALIPVIQAGVWAVAIVLVAVAAIIAVAWYHGRQLEVNNRLMRDLCEKAQATGDRATVASCIEATKGLQNVDMFGLQSLGKTLAVTALLVGGLWLAATYGPALLAKRRAARS